MNDCSSGNSVDSHPDSAPAGAPASSGAIEVAVLGLWRWRHNDPSTELRGSPIEILIARRHSDAMLGGLWELPGGKVERGESIVAAAQREALEETGIAITTAEEAGVVEGGGRLDRGHNAPRVRLHALVAEVATTVEAKPLASAECRWITLDDMENFEWPEANRALNALVRRAIERAVRASTPSGGAGTPA